MRRDEVSVRDLGLIEYEAAYALQHRTVADRLSGEEPSDVLYLLEHPEVYTFGRRAQAQTPADLHCVAVERGGRATYHNPGQLVAYPILKLEGRDQDLHAYLRQLEATLIEMLGVYGLATVRREGATGVWLKDRQKKIASIGVAVKAWVTYHGVALNVCNDLAGFSKINPCGFDAQVMTSLSVELGLPVSIEDAKSRFVEAFYSSFCS